jgi:hypothetical protein
MAQAHAPPDRTRGHHRGLRRRDDRDRAPRRTHSRGALRTALREALAHSGRHISGCALALPADGGGSRRHEGTRNTARNMRNCGTRRSYRCGAHICVDGRLCAPADHACPTLKRARQAQARTVRSAGESKVGGHRRRTSRRPTRRFGRRAQFGMPTPSSSPPPSRGLMAAPIFAPSPSPHL